MFSLANPYGLLALLGVPAVLAIHFLQRKATELPVSTLFLLERTHRDAASGRRLDRIISSVPLWMQLLAVLLLAWFLSEPRLQRTGSVQRIAVVVDSSASMGVFKQEAVKRLTEELPSFQGSSATIELTVMESAPGRPRLYAGSSVTELKAVLEKWQPLDGLTDPSQALRLGRSLVSQAGTVIYLTDTPVNALPFDAKLVAVGEPIENVGFTGVTFATEEGALVWRALVRNYSKSDVDRNWSVVTASGSTEPRPLHLAAGSLVTLQSAFPSDAKNVRISLTNDRFPLDDTLPIVAPAPKTLTLFTSTSPAFADLTTKLLRSLDAAVPTQDAATADLSISSYDPLDPVLPTGNLIVFVEDSTRTGAYLKGGIVAAASPLMDRLNWQSLLVRETIMLDPSPSDTVLLWQEKRPLIFIREHEGNRQLCFNFDLRLSNASSQPAFIVLLHRFAETIRAAKVSPASENLETGQPIKVPSAPGIPVKATFTNLAGKSVPFNLLSSNAPLVPGFLTVQQHETRLLDAAISFADTREADFSACGKSDPTVESNKESIERHTKPDPLWRVWILLLLAALLVSWRFSTRRVTA